MNEARWIIVGDERRARIVSVTSGRARELCRTGRDAATGIVDRASAERTVDEVALVMKSEHLAAFRARMGRGNEIVRVEVRLPLFHASLPEIERRVAWAALELDRVRRKNPPGDSPRVNWTGAPLLTSISTDRLDRHTFSR